MYEFDAPEITAQRIVIAAYISRLVNPVAAPPHGTKLVLDRQHPSLQVKEGHSPRNLRKMAYRYAIRLTDCIEAHLGEGHIAIPEFLRDFESEELGGHAVEQPESSIVSAVMSALTVARGQPTADAAIEDAVLNEFKTTRLAVHVVEESGLPTLAAPSSGADERYKMVLLFHVIGIPV